MNCCSPVVVDTGRLFSTFAGLNRLRFRLLGFEKTQRQLIEGLERAGIEGTDLLEVGCGPGFLHQALLLSGGARAVGVDLSERMLEIARSGAQAQGLEGRVDYRLGDFVQIADGLPDVDVTILDKVVCCYPDWQALVDRSLARTRRVYGLTYPRDRASTRVAIRLMRWGLQLTGCCYQPYLHDPALIEARILGQGFRLGYQVHTMTWLTQVYTRSALSGP